MGQQGDRPGWLQCGTARRWAGLAAVWDSKEMGRAGSNVGQQGDGPGWLQCGTARRWAGLALVWDSKEMGRAVWDKSQVVCVRIS